MEGSNLQEDDSITDSQIISKVTSVVTGSSSTPSVTITTTVPRIKTNGQAVLLQAPGVPGQQQQQPQQQQQQIHHHQSSPTPMTIVSGSNIVVGAGGGGVSSAGSTIVSTINNTNNTNNNNTNTTNSNNQPNQTAVNHHQHHSGGGGGGAAHKSVPTVTTVPASSQSSHQQQQQHQHQQQQSMVSAGSMSIVQFQLPTNQSPSTTMVQSVIQPNHQSVIQQTNPISAIQLPKNVILVNKLPGSVIQSTESESNIQMVKEEHDAVNQIFEDEPKRRREILARRPSYRKILNDLSAADTGGGGGGGGGSTNVEVNKSESEESDQTSPTNSQSSSATAISLPTSYIKMLPLGQLNSQDGTIQGIPTIMNPNTGSNTIVQYATSGHDGQFIVPADLQAYQLRPQNPSAIAQNVVMTSQNIPTHTVDEALKKREMRLLKNREAAKECRRKKKEYIKCLENRVAVLENQNKALIDELKTLKELYCKKSD